MEPTPIQLKFGTEMKQSKIRESVLLPQLGNQSQTSQTLQPLHSRECPLPQGSKPAVVSPLPKVEHQVIFLFSDSPQPTASTASFSASTAHHTSYELPFNILPFLTKTFLKTKLNYS